MVGAALLFLPQENIPKRVKQDRVPYDIWEKQGLFTLTPGNVVDTSFIRVKLNELANVYKVQEVGFDRALSADITPALESDGFTMVPILQSDVALTPPIKKLMELVLRQEIRHGGHPVLAWQAGNAVIRTGATGLMRIDKERSRERIDGLDALLDALARAMVVPITPAGFEYRGLRSV